MAKGLDKEYHVYRCRLGHRHRAGPAEGALCYEKGSFPRQLRRGESSQSATRRPPRRPSSFPSDTTLVCQANQHAHAHKHSPQGCVEKAALLAGWLAYQSRGLACWLVGCSLLGGGGIGAKETERSLSFTPRTTRSTWNFELQVATLREKEMCSPPSVVRG